MIEPHRRNINGLTIPIDQPAVRSPARLTKKIKNIIPSRLFRVIVGRNSGEHVIGAHEMLFKHSTSPHNVTFFRTTVGIQRSTPPAAFVNQVDVTPSKTTIANQENSCGKCCNSTTNQISTLV